MPNNNLSKIEEQILDNAVTGESGTVLFKYLNSIYEDRLAQVLLKLEDSAEEGRSEYLKCVGIFEIIDLLTRRLDGIKESRKR